MPELPGITDTQKALGVAGGAQLAADPAGNMQVITGPNAAFPLASIKTQHSADEYSVRSKGSLAFDWRGTLTGTGFTLDATATCPTGAGVVYLAGEGTTDTTGNTQNNQCTMTLATAVSTANNAQWLINLRVPKRNIARKNYRSCPLSVLLSADSGFAKFLTFTVNVIADGKWRTYSLDLKNPTANDGTFVVGTDSIITARIRPTIVNAVGSNTAQLQVGEKAYFGGIVSNPRAKAMAIIRFDDGLSSLYSRKACTVSTLFSGASGVNVAAGSYSVYELVSAFGFVGTCFLLSSKFGSTYSNYETVANLKMLQSLGWEMCWQTHANPLAQSGVGARLLGPLGAPWLATQSISHTAAGVITSPTAHDFAYSYGETSQISPIGAPPAPLVAGATYYTRRITTTTFTLHNTEQDAYNGTNIITYAADSTATWGWNHPGATTDSSGIDAEFAAGKAAMIANGFAGWMHWAPNQGACDESMENAWYNIGCKTLWPIDLGVVGSALGRTTHFKLTVGFGNMTISPSSITTRSCGLLDTLNEAQARAYVQQICQAGAIGQGLLHEPGAGSTLALLGYLDELKLRQDAGEIEVATPTRVKAYLDAVQL